MSDEDRDSQTAESFLAASVREHRRARGWSQGELANQMQVQGFNWLQSTVAKTEVGERAIRVNEAMALAQVFGTSIDTLIGEGPVRIGALLVEVSLRRRQLQQRIAELDKDRVAAERRLAEVTAQESAIEALARFTSDARVDLLVEALNFFNESIELCNEDEIVERYGFIARALNEAGILGEVPLALFRAGWLDDIPAVAERIMAHIGRKADGQHQTSA